MKYLPILVPLWLASPVFAANADRPNILFIIVDDQSPFDLKVYNPKSALNTPVIDKLAADGMVFDGAYQMGAWSGAVCTPSRHMIMSGRTLWHIPGRHPLSADPNYVPTDLPSHTLPAVFNDAGYDTMRTCKQGNSYAAANKLFTVVRDATKRGGTDETGSAWHAKQVLDYLQDRERTKESDPFLIYFGFSHPHDTRDGKPELLAHYGAVNHKDKNSLPPANPKQPPLPANYLSAHPFDNTHMNVRDEVSVSGVWKNRDEQTIRNEIGREFACSENIDIQIGGYSNNSRRWANWTTPTSSIPRITAWRSAVTDCRANRIFTSILGVSRSSSKAPASCRDRGRSATSTCSTCLPRCAISPRSKLRKPVKGSASSPS